MRIAQRNSSVSREHVKPKLILARQQAVSLADKPVWICAPTIRIAEAAEMPVASGACARMGCVLP